MKYITYKLKGSSVQMIFSEENERKALLEADDGTIQIDTTDSPETGSSVESDIDRMLIDHEYRLTLLELGLAESEV